MVGEQDDLNDMDLVGIPHPRQELPIIDNTVVPSMLQKINHERIYIYIYIYTSSHLIVHQHPPIQFSLTYSSIDPVT